MYKTMVEMLGGSEEGKRQGERQGRQERSKKQRTGEKKGKERKITHYFVKKKHIIIEKNIKEKVANSFSYSLLPKSISQETTHNPVTFDENLLQELMKKLDEIGRSKRNDEKENGPVRLEVFSPTGELFEVREGRNPTPISESLGSPDETSEKLEKFREVQHLKEEAGEETVYWSVDNQNRVELLNHTIGTSRRRIDFDNWETLLIFHQVLNDDY